jgi:protein-tyrosine phosphatase
MKYAIVFFLLAAYLIALGALVGGLGWLLLWPGISFAILGSAYTGLGPGVLGKRPDGRVAWWAVLLLLPYLLLTWGVWHLQRRLSKEDCCNEVAPRLWLGRRPFPRELPAGVDLVVDLTAEFPAARGLTAGRAYRCLPTLDALVPGDADVEKMVAEVANWPGIVYVHCALGHGRSALLTAAVLLRRGLAANPREAEALLRQARPAVRLKPPQRRLLERLAEDSL